MKTDKRFTVCRLCLNASEVLFDVFERRDGYIPANVIVELLQFEVSLEDIYPQCVCGGCLEKLKDFKKFKEKCEACKVSLDCAYAAKCAHIPDVNPHKVEAGDGEMGFLKVEEVITPDVPSINNNADGGRIKGESCMSYRDAEPMGEGSDIDQWITSDDAKTLVLENPKVVPNVALEDLRRDDVPTAVIKDEKNTTSLGPQPSAEEERQERPQRVTRNMLAHATAQGVGPNMQPYYAGADGNFSGEAGACRLLKSSPTQSTVIAIEAKEVKQSLNTDDNGSGMSLPPKQPPTAVDLQLSPEICQAGQEGHPNPDELKFRLEPPSSLLPDVISGGTKPSTSRTFRRSSSNTSLAKKSQFSALEMWRKGSGQKPKKSISQEPSDKKDDAEEDQAAKSMKDDDSSSSSDSEESNFSSDDIEDSGINKSKDSNIFKSEPVEGKLSRHIKGCETFKCRLCGKGYSRKDYLQDHIAAHTLGRLYECDTCGKNYVMKRYLKLHLKIHDQQNYVCDVCGKVFKTKMTLYSHKKRHGNKNYICELCGKNFFTSSGLKDHLAYHNKEKIYPCDTCGKRFSHKHILKSHLKIHSGNRNLKHSCDECGKMFSTPATLKTHKKTHTGERPFTCSVCGKGFTTKNGLTRHMNTHSRDTSYKCDICAAVFSQPEGLNRHRDRHTGAKKYKCDKCGKEYTQSHNLKNHKKTHLNE